MTDRRYELIIAPTARRQLAEQLPESVAFAAYEFIIDRYSTIPTASTSSCDRRCTTATARAAAPIACSTESTMNANESPSSVCSAARTHAVPTHSRRRAGSTRVRDAHWISRHLGKFKARRLERRRPRD